MVCSEASLGANWVGCPARVLDFCNHHYYDPRSCKAVSCIHWKTRHKEFCRSYRREIKAHCQEKFIPHFRSQHVVLVRSFDHRIIFPRPLAAPLLAPPDPHLEFSTFKDIGELNRYVPFQPKPGLLLGSVPDPANRRQLDIWYSLVWGTRSALRFGLLVGLFTGTFGIILGGVSAYLGGTLNTLIMGFTDAFLTFPIIAGVIFFNQFILMLLSSSGILVFWNGMLPILGDSPTAWQLFLMDLDPLLIAFIVFSWMPYARLMNSVVLTTRQEEYVLAARSVGFALCA